MTLIRHVALAFVALMALTAVLCEKNATEAQSVLPCEPFTRDFVAPARRDDPHARALFEQINAAVKTQPHRVLFLGDSLTEGFNTDVWRDHLAPRGVLNAGIGGDATEELLWRLEHGNLDGPPPQVVVMLIGTNDLSRGRTPEAAAEGVRANLLTLRQRLPGAGILLLGLWPREDVPRILERRDIAAVNTLISTCADGVRIRYADIGRLLLEPDGRLSPKIAPDRVHFSAKGYARIAPPLDELIDQLLYRR